LSCHPDCEKSSNRALIKLALLSALKTCLEQVDALLQTTTHIHKDARPQTQFRKEPTSAAAAAAAAYCTVSSLCASSSPPLKCGSTPAAPFLPPPSFCTSPHKDCQGGSPYNARAQQHHIGTCTALHTARAQQHPASCTSPCNRGVLQREQHSSLVTASAFPCCLLYCHPLCLRPCLTLELALK